MKGLERLDLVDKIGRELQSRMTFSDIANYLSGFDIDTDHQPSYNSKHVYVKEVLAKINESIILSIADELRIDHQYGQSLTVETDPTFWKTGYFKLFISHLASFKVTVSELKNALDKYGVSAFVAHEDIEPTLEWQTEIEKGLFTMDAMCAVLMDGFSESKWTDQEIGVAFGLGKLIVPIRRGLDPYGFIGKFQGFQAQGKSVGQVAKAIFTILASHPKTSSLITSRLSDLFILSNTNEQALDRIASLKLIGKIPQDRILFLHERIQDNQLLSSANILNEFNELTQPYGLRKIQKQDFDKGKIVYGEDDDLPF